MSASIEVEDASSSLRVTSLPPPSPAVAAADVGGPHAVEFYDEDEQLVRAVASFAVAGLTAGEQVRLIATEDHARLYRQRLASAGIDVTAALTGGQLAIADADQCLAAFMRDGSPDRALFERCIEPLLGQPLAAGVRQRAFGEMVDVLWRRGERSAALELEELWNYYQERHAFTLLCAYSIAGLYKDPAALHGICRAHTHVGGVDAGGAAVDSSLPSRYVRELTRELERREEIERELRQTMRQLRGKEDELRGSEEQLRDFVENAIVGLHRVGPDGTILWANRAELQLLGYSADEYIGRSIRDFHVDAEVIEDIVARLARGEALESYEARLRARDGSIKHVLISSNVYAPDGRFTYTRCFTRDITGRRAAEQALRESEAAAADRARRLLTVTAAIADAVDADDVLTAVVDRLAVAIGASTAALWLLDDDDVAVRLARSVGYDDGECARLAVVPLATTPSVPVLDAVRTGQPVWLSSKAELLRAYPHLQALASDHRSYRLACLPLVSRAQTVGALVLTMDDERDVDDEDRDLLLVIAGYASQAMERLRLARENEAARARAEHLYRFAEAVVSAERIEDVYDVALGVICEGLATERAAILLFDDEGVMRFRAARGLSSEYQAAVEGHTPWPRDVVAPRPVLVEDTLAEPTLATYRSLFEREGIGSLAFIPLYSRGGLIGKFMVYHPGAHRYAASEVELATAIANHLASVISRFHAFARLEETIRYNELFAGVLAHDLRNPLGAIVTATQIMLMRHDADGERQVKPLARILSSGQRMSRMIDQLLDFTRARVGGGIDVRPRPANLAELCDQAIAELELAYPDWRIERCVLGDLDGAWDPDRLLQIISNLIGNAGQHGDLDAGILVLLDGRAADQVTLRVHNKGTIPPGLLPGLFDPFRATRHRRDQSRGLGLGLFIVKELIRAHGGTVEVTSSDAAGTTFVIVLPRHAGAPTAP
jgi:PAS domain S-box-containing protein